MSALHGAASLKAGAATQCPRPLAPGLISVVASAIRHAWATIEADPSAHLVLTGPKPNEDTFTYAIAEMLEQMLYDPSLSVEGFSADFFSSVVRGAAVANVTHSVLTKQPDLMIRLVERDQYNLGRYIGVFVEAKVVGSGVTAYTDDGILRFVDGQYAWAMRDGVMLAYQANGVTQLSTLRARLQSHASLAAQAADPALSDVLHEDPIAHVCARSVHGRNWTYNDNTPPGPIHLWHLWELQIPAAIWPKSEKTKSGPARKKNAKTGTV